MPTERAITREPLPECVLSWNTLKQQRDDLLAASRKMLPFCDSTQHGKKAAAEALALIKRIEASNA